MEPKIVNFILKNRYCSMKQRCLNPKLKNYPNYGGRGIKVLWKSCAEFKKDMMSSFLSHVKKHGKDTSIDRIDNNGHYCKENCRWSTRKEQANNTRRHKYITFKGATLNLTEWSKKLGISVSTLEMRVFRGDVSSSRILRPTNRL